MKRLLILIRLWFDWRKRVSGHAVVDWTRGCGYYLRDIGRVETFAMQSCRRGVYKLLAVDTFSDPRDMIRESQWQFICYEGQKPFSEMSFREYCAARLI
jgi:hypothetical protein